MRTKLSHLHEVIQSVCPIEGLTETANGSISVDFSAEATDEQKGAAQEQLLQFDWSDGAHSIWLTSLTKVAAKSRVDTPQEPIDLATTALGSVILPFLNTLAERINAIASHVNYVGEPLHYVDIAAAKQAIKTIIDNLSL